MGVIRKKEGWKEGADNGDGSAFSVSVEDAKCALRQSMKEAIAAMTREERAAADEALCRRLEDELTACCPAGSAVLGYMPMADEPDLLPLWTRWLTAGRRLVLPRVVGDGLELCEIKDLTKDVAPGAFGILEPVAGCRLVGLEDVAVIVTPGRAFSTTGARLGRGKGYYDRLFADADNGSRPVTIAVAYDAQIMVALPSAVHDRPVDRVITPTSMWPKT